MIGVKTKIDELKDMCTKSYTIDSEIVTNLLDALSIACEDLEHSNNGCLVPPDGGSPDVYYHINNAKQALKKFR